MKSEGLHFSRMSLEMSLTPGGRGGGESDKNPLPRISETTRRKSFLFAMKTEFPSNRRKDSLVQYSTVCSRLERFSWISSQPFRTR